MNDFKFKILKSSEVDQQTEQDIMNCFNKTFDQKKSNLYFNWKFRENPFGDSIHVLIYFKDDLISTRAFWRLDIENNKKFYQCVDTSVLKKYHGIGIFRKSTEHALKYFDGEAIYNYPNKNSFQAYLKLGWKQNEPSFIRFNLTKFIAQCTPIINWSIDKLRWRFCNNPEVEYYSYKFKNEYLILRKKKFMFISIGRVKFNLGLKKVTPLILFSYDKGVNGFKVPNKKALTLSKNFKVDYIPFYHFDMM